MARIQALTVKEMMSKAHMQVHTNNGSRGKQAWRKPGPKRDWAGRPGPISPAHSGPGSTPPFDLAASWAIYSPLAKSDGERHSSSAAEEQRREGHRSGEERVEMVD
jgi:hypothetical protein